MTTATLLLDLAAVVYAVECLPEDSDPRDSFASVEAGASLEAAEAIDAAVRAEIVAALDGGSPWAWCTIRVTATLGGFTGADVLGCCSYRSESDFIEAGDYWPDMQREALADLRAKLTAAGARFSDGAAAPESPAWDSGVIAGLLAAAGAEIRHCVNNVVKAARMVEIDAMTGAMRGTLIDVRDEDGVWLLRAQYQAGGWSAPEPVTDAAALRAALAVALATVEPIPPLALAVRVTVEVPMAAVHTLLVSALDGWPGSGGWIRRGSFSATLPEGFRAASLPWLDADEAREHDEGDANGRRVSCDYFAPIVVGGRWSFREDDDSEENAAPLVLDLAAVERGLAVMAARYPQAFADVGTSRADAVTADVLVQCAVFGEVVYG